MLPRVQSYLLSDSSWFWSQPTAQFFANLPVRGEHQMFVGALTLCLTFASIIYGFRKIQPVDSVYSLLIFALAFLIVVTINLGGFSLWYFVHWLPLASAIRVMTRVDLILLFPVAFISSYFVDRVIEKKWFLKRLFVIILMPLLLIEYSSISINASSKLEWRDRINNKIKQVPAEIHSDSILFFGAPASPDFYKDELDAMWASLVLNKKTMNGYSGALPPGYNLNHGSDCAVVSERIKAFKEFKMKNKDRREMVDAAFDHVLPIGFHGCNNIRG
jgi:hypothetical protein